MVGQASQIMNITGKQGREEKFRLHVTLAVEEAESIKRLREPKKLYRGKHILDRVATPDELAYLRGNASCDSLCGVTWAWSHS
jgi:hypothetical protein